MSTAISPAFLPSASLNLNLNSKTVAVCHCFDLWIACVHNAARYNGTIVINDAS